MKPKGGITSFFKVINKVTRLNRVKRSGLNNTRYLKNASGNTRYNDSVSKEVNDEINVTEDEVKSSYFGSRFLRMIGKILLFCFVLSTKMIFKY